MRKLVKKPRVVKRAPRAIGPLKDGVHLKVRGFNSEQNRPKPWIKGAERQIA